MNTKIKIRETRSKDPDLKYRFKNSAEHPLSKEHYAELVKANGLIYNNPQDYYDPEYGSESWLLWGDKARVSGYFFNEKGIKMLKRLSYKIEIDTVAERQAKSREQRRKEMIRSDLYNSILRFIKKHGEQPHEKTKITLKGDRIYTPYSNKDLMIYGGGNWFIEDGEYIWYVKNNGADGDYWGANNVATGGAGAIGWRIPKSDYIIEKISLIQKSVKDITEENEANYLFNTDKVYEGS